MQYLFFVQADHWAGNNPFIMDESVPGLDTEEKLEEFARGWASSFPDDLVMLID